MLDQGFENDIRRIIAHCPDHQASRQTVMCESLAIIATRMHCGELTRNTQSLPLGPSPFVVWPVLSYVILYESPLGAKN